MVGMHLRRVKSLTDHSLLKIERIGSLLIAVCHYLDDQGIADYSVIKIASANGGLLLILDICGSIRRQVVKS